MPKKLCSREYLEGIYKKYHHRCFVHPDPLEFLYRYKDGADREIAGFIASSLAYGRVNQILKSVDSVLAPMEASPKDFLHSFRKEIVKDKSKKTVYGNFKHRFTTSKELYGFLAGILGVLDNYESLGSCFKHGYTVFNGDYLKALSFFVEEIKKHAGYKSSDNMTLLPEPSRGSSCKRLNLYLRWMVRSDNVDPGGWTGIPKTDLLVPLDTHMFQFAVTHGLTSRKSADLKTVLEITKSMKAFSPDDPLRYDFSITRIGIRGNNCREESDELHG